jgi:peptidoglycan/xylan/chitin deacetylase (PgdA/CDA1 family)
VKSPAQIATFLYHDIADHPSESGFQRRSALPYKQTRRVFEEHLDSIGLSGFVPRAVSTIDLRKPAKHVMITFDDGGKGALHAAEMLNRRGWTGHFFVTTSLIGTPTFLDEAAIRHLHSCGHVIGSHSHTHPDIFKAQTFEQMVQEWRTSCAILSDLLGVKTATASVPGGDVSRRVYQSAPQAGIEYLFTSEPVLKPEREGECWILGRVCPKSDAPLTQIQGLAEFRGWAEERLRRQLKTTVKTALFPLYRLYVSHAVRQS